VKRNKAGCAYIYFNYGMHWMLNVLVKGGIRNGLILIRALEPRSGIALMKKRRGIEDIRQLCSGPGKLTQALAITDRPHKLDLCVDPRRFNRRETAGVDAVADARIGMSASPIIPGVSLCGSPFVSRTAKV
jgi:DNA-3-methyladenine glycosylase